MGLFGLFGRKQRNKGTVCVTGASGFIGSHVVEQLLEKGYTVRGTVRDAKDTNKYGWLHDLASGLKGALRLSSADLRQPGSFDEAIGGCEYVCHVAAVVQFDAKNPQRDIVDPTVEGTRNVFNAIIKTKKAKRVVLTSSYVAVVDNFGKDGTVFTENDWHKEMSLKDPYPLAKTLSERHAWRVYQEQKDRAARGEDRGWSFELVALNPGVVLGNLHHKSHGFATTPSIIRELMSGKVPAVPRFAYPVVHVKDVALAHVRALEDKKTSGRYLLGENKTVTKLLDMGTFVKERFPNCKVPSGTVPDWMTYALSLLHPDLGIGFVKRNVGRERFISSEKATKELGITFRQPKEAVWDTYESCVKHGLIDGLS